MATMPYRPVTQRYLPVPGPLPAGQSKPHGSHRPSTHHSLGRQQVAPHTRHRSQHSPAMQRWRPVQVQDPHAHAPSAPHRSSNRQQVPPHIRSAGQQYDGTTVLSPQQNASSGCGQAKPVQSRASRPVLPFGQVSQSVKVRATGQHPPSILR